MGNSSEALKRVENILRKEKLGVGKMLRASYIAANSLFLLGDGKIAQDLLMKARNADLNSNEIWLGKIEIWLAEFSINDSDLISGVFHNNLAFQYFSKVSYKNGLALVLSLQGLIEVKKNDFEKAKSLFQESLSGFNYCQNLHSQEKIKFI